MQLLHEYVDDVAPGQAWGAIDASGKLQLHGHDLPSPPTSRERQVEFDEFVPSLLFARDKSPRDPFSDLGQWMLKVLFAPDVQDRYLSAPHEAIESISDLARSAKVSLASASRQVGALESLQFLERRPAKLQLVRRQRLFERWASVAVRSQEERRVRFLVPASDGQARLEESLARQLAHHSVQQLGPGEQAGPKGSRVCLSWFAACRKLDLGHVRGAPLHLYAEDISERALARLDLYPVVDGASFDAIAVAPRYPESVFNGCVVRDGVPAADALQCWLDVRSHPSRGDEQAAEIERRIERVFSND